MAGKTMAAEASKARPMIMFKMVWKGLAGGEKGVFSIILSYIIP